MRIILLCSCAMLAFFSSFGQGKKNTPLIYIDKQGVMRWSDNKQEASFYGVNYTLPFAHAYRAIKAKGIDHKAAIDRDVYHFARLGFNAYRIHLWDVELSDGEGNLLLNEHLDLLDYLFFKLQERGIHILITAMTNFGNGYPERNEQTGAFSYLYDKCLVHQDPKAIAAQKRYIYALLRHVNPYTKVAYQDDPYVIGFEINNEPCHTGELAITSHYIKEMLASMKAAGNKKPVFYNVSHNRDHVPAYFNAPIQGTTYQWYPIGLVAGRQRLGNFLPYVDRYPIPFSNIEGFNNKAKAVYEYDPADNLYSYMHPAMSRTFRSAGFQWITQFAYDPIDIAAYNTEYQTHYLNLAYTPAKAISTMIAAEVAYNIPRNQSYPDYPRDTLFGNFMVSYTQDLSVMNTKDKFYYSNETNVQPVDLRQLAHIAGHGSSPVIHYTGSGAYFLDRLEEGIWRLEVMPDAEPVIDPFEKPSLSRAVVDILWTPQHMTIRLPDLGEDFAVQALSEQTDAQPAAERSRLTVRPGVYLLRRKERGQPDKWDANSSWKSGKLGAFVAPLPSVIHKPIVLHEPDPYWEKGQKKALQMRVIFPTRVDSVIVQTDQVSFWREDNPSVKMTALDAYTFRAVIPEKLIKDGMWRYTATVYVDGKSYTYPDSRQGTPLDWDYNVTHYWSTRIVDPEDRLLLASPWQDQPVFDHFAIPETSYATYEKEQSSFTTAPIWTYSFRGKDTAARHFWIRDIKKLVDSRPQGVGQATSLCAYIRAEGYDDWLELGFVTKVGYTYVKKVSLAGKDRMGTILRIPLSELRQTATALLPAPYPTFLPRYFSPTVDLPWHRDDMEKLVLSTHNGQWSDAKISIGAVWLE
ncbi:hypothetical protein [Olivibacter sp. XZL3]|uniref:hypothetical protein n=1 Tax=Olivibacter sp. XZL3 TaxID=1735116 RepID=UPI00198167EB|nr:hypothetical protein [Olivibacter sp. XZL3]